MRRLSLPEHRLDDPQRLSDLGREGLRQRILPGDRRHVGPDLERILDRLAHELCEKQLVPEPFILLDLRTLTAVIWPFVSWATATDMGCFFPSTRMNWATPYRFPWAIAK